MAHLPTWLSEVLANVNDEDIETVAKRLSGIEKGEEVIGEISDNTKAIYTAWIKQVDICTALAKNHEKEHTSPDHTPDQCEKFHHDICLALQIREAFKELFWATAQTELNVSGDIGIRKGWQLVKVPEEKKGAGMILIARG